MKNKNKTIKEGIEPLNNNNIVIIKRLAALGLSDREIAHVIGMKMFEFRKMKEDKQFSQALEHGRENLDRKVEHALYTRALGFEYAEVTESVSEKAPAGKSKSVSEGTKNKTKSQKDTAQKETAQKGETVKTINRRVIPDVTACIFWLKNRQPEKWSDSKDGNSGESLKELIERYNEENPDECNISN